MLYKWKASRWSSHGRILDAFPPDGRGRRLLDVGCGDGYLGAILAGRGFLVTGVERSGGFSNRFPSSVELVVADLESGLPKLPYKFDFVLCADILEHLRDPGALLSQVSRVLGPDGCLVASLPNSGNIWFRGNVLLGRFPQDDKGLFDRTHLRFYTLDGWRKLFAGAGFRFSSVQPTAMPVSLLVPPSQENSFPVRAAESVFYGLARIWKTMFAYQFVVRAEPDSR